MPVRRFPVELARLRLQAVRAPRVPPAHTLEDERTFVDAQGRTPGSSSTSSGTGGTRTTSFFTYIYYPTVLGLPLVPDRAVLVPTAHEESAIGLAAYQPVFHGPRTIAYNTEEERAWYAPLPE